MTELQPPSRRPPTVASWVALVVALGASAAVAIYVPLSRRDAFRTFHALRIELPQVTQWMLSVPTAAIVTAGVLLAGAAVAAQWVQRRRGGATGALLLISLVCVVVLGLYRETLMAAYQAFAGYLMHGAD